MHATASRDHLERKAGLPRRVASSFDREALATAKAQINRFGVPTATELQSSNDLSALGQADDDNTDTKTGASSLGA